MQHTLFVLLFSLLIIYSVPFQESFPFDFFIIRIGKDYQSGLTFTHLLKQEGYNCCSNVYLTGGIGIQNWHQVHKMITDSENYIIWISTENDYNKCSMLDWCINNVRFTSALRHGYFLPYIFRLNNCLVPKDLNQYETYELSSNFQCKMPEILEYLKRGPTKGIYC